MLRYKARMTFHALRIAGLQVAVKTCPDRSYRGSGIVLGGHWPVTIRAIREWKG